jgi:hypothetical protein
MQAGQRMGWGASLALALTTTRGAEVDVMAKVNYTTLRDNVPPASSV